MLPTTIAVGTLVTECPYRDPNNAVTADNLPKLINDVHRALAGAGQAAAALLRGEPAVPVKKSVLADHLVCLEYGKPFPMLKRHLATNHQLTPEQYRQKWDLPLDKTLWRFASGRL